ncbi:hypothetical protein [Roseovarius sp.]|uniref:hypothetical protein n=1 Tax=Roseovarius sp. TaxID=1486281 RepID=UPI0035649777
MEENGPDPKAKPFQSVSDGAPKAGQGSILRPGNVIRNIERRSADEEFAFTQEMAEEAEGNFFLSFGKVGAGKTTLHFHLLRYFEQRPDFEGEELVDPGLSDGQRAAQSQLITNWRNRWSDGTFPSATLRTDEVRALRYSVRPTIGNGPRTNITFLEVAGELLSDLVTDDLDQRQELPGALRALLDNKDVNLIIAFVVAPTALEAEEDGKYPDTLYTAFLNYIRGHHSAGPDRTRTPLMIVINNPDEGFRVIPRLNIDQQGATTWTPEIVEKFLEYVLPSFIQAYRRWPAKAKKITLFKVGSVKTVPGPDGREIPIIGNPPYYRHAAIVSKFIYETFTGIRIRHPLWKRLLMAMKISS